MAHGYHTLQHWNQWLSHHFLGRNILAAEEHLLEQLLSKHYGKHALLIGVPQQYDLLKATTIPCHSLLTPFASKQMIPGYIEGDFHELPLLTGSIDLVMLPHTLEYTDNPRQLLAEACRVIKPEGIIVITGFNPYSLWGLKRLLAKNKTIPWKANFIRAQKVKSWLRLVDFQMEQHKSALYAPPLNHSKTYNKLHFLERAGSKFLPGLGGVYVLIARAKVIPLTPIRLKWKQQLSGIRLPTTMTGHIARDSLPMPLDKIK